MRLISLNVGLPRIVSRNREPITTGIFKEPVTTRVALRKHNLDGDRQADLTVHGGPTKAVYVYPSEHYEFWRHELPDTELPWGSFGENFTTEGLLESQVCIGDRFGVGSAVVMVTEPRLPCYKLGIRFGRSDILRRFLASERTGFYLAVVREGQVAAGDVVHLIEQDKNAVRVADVTRLYLRDRTDVEAMRRVVAVPALPDNWRASFQQRIAAIDANEMGKHDGELGKDDLR
jgi:MOSC domain-containing protein YiiM